MYQLLLGLHVVIAVFLVIFILMQQGRGAQTGASFGSGASTTIFGSQGSAGFLSKFTWILVGCFFVVNLGLAYMTNRYVNQATDFSVQIEAPGSEIPGNTSSDKNVAPSDIPKN